MGINPIDEEDSPELRGVPYMPLHGDRLFKSETWIKASAEAKVAMLRLWWQAFAHEVPPGTLPDDDAMLADYAGYGVMIEAFKAIKAQAMRHFQVRDDGRLHHEFVKELAERAWKERKRSREKQAAWRQRKRDGNVTGSGGSDDRPKQLQQTNDVTGNVTGDVTVKHATGIGTGIGTGKVKEEVKPMPGKPGGAGGPSHKDASTAKRVIAYLNEKAGTRYQCAKAHEKLIMARVHADGATEGQMRQVIDVKCDEARRGEFDRRWLSPDTLFNATKYAKYVGQLDTQLPQVAKGQQQRMVIVLGETATGDAKTITTFTQKGELDRFKAAQNVVKNNAVLIKQSQYRYILIEENGAQPNSRYSVEELQQ